MKRIGKAGLAAIFTLILLPGCAALFGWNIHAPGVLSDGFIRTVQPLSNRVALYLEPSVFNYVSKNRGGRFADPQTYYVGEAYAPMIVEGYQNAFEEFIFMETEPTPEIIRQYGIQYVTVVKIKGLGNKVTLKGQGLTLATETVVFDSQFKYLAHFESIGSSDAEKIFAKKGGPEVNLNAAIENNVLALVQYLQDSIRTGNWN